MLPEALLARLKDRLAEQIGLNFSGTAWRDFDSRIAAAAREDGIDEPRHYVDELLSAPLPQSRIETLARHLTIGETYFFREKASFDALAEHILPAMLRGRESTQRRLRIWSAGCCTGEEAYSIAMLLDRVLPRQEGWDIRITATDINPHFLRKARRAVYKDWSFRGTPAWVRKDYFRKKRNGTLEVLPRIRERVDFAYFNLADSGHPPLIGRDDRLDIIFCRNVLMYFSQEQAKRVISRFRALLHEEGMLLVSPTETSTTLFRDFSAVYYPDAIFYRLREARAPRQAPLRLPVPPHPARQAPTRKPAAKPRVPPPGEKATLDASPSRADANELAGRARRSADAGKLDDAAQWCAQAISRDKLNPAFHYLLATIEQERGMMQAAAQALQSTLYLDQDFVLAHFALANLRLTENRLKEAMRHLDIVRKLLKNFASDDILPESEGLTAGRLDEISATLIVSLGEAQRST